MKPRSDVDTFRQPLIDVHPKLVENLHLLHDIFSPSSDNNVSPTFELDTSSSQKLLDGPATNLRSVTTGGPTRNHIGFDVYFIQHTTPSDPKHITSTMPMPPITPPVDIFDVAPLPPEVSSSLPTTSPDLLNTPSSSEQRVSGENQRVAPKKRTTTPQPSCVPKTVRPSRFSTKRRRSRQVTQSEPPPTLFVHQHLLPLRGPVAVFPLPDIVLCTLLFYTVPSIKPLFVLMR